MDKVTIIQQKVTTFENKVMRFEHEMPNINLRYWPISPDDLMLSVWWSDPNLVRLLVREYSKFLAEFIRL